MFGKWTAMCKRMKLHHSLMSYKKIYSTWIKDLTNGKAIYYKTLKRKTQAEHSDINGSSSFLDSPPRVTKIKKILKMGPY